MDKKINILTIAGMLFLTLVLGAGYALKNFYTAEIDSTPDLPRMESIASDADSMYNPVVQLKDKEGHFHCSATVFDAQYAVTAAHCLTNFEGNLSKEDIKIANDEGKDTGVVAKPAGLNKRIDFGIIKGDFRKFKKAVVETYDNNFIKPKHVFITCGFAYGQNKLSCTPFAPINNLYFHVRGLGALVPGMSGGPVVDVITGTVVGVNSSVDDGFVQVVPLMGMFGAFGIEK